MFSSPIVLRMPPHLKMTDDDFFELCQINRELLIERNKLGELLVSTLKDATTGSKACHILGQLGIWSEENGTGIGFSLAGFTLSTGAVRSALVAWMKLERWNGLTPEQKEKFAPICPDFVLELKSPSEELKPLQEKMEEYMEEPGIQLGWLIDRKNRNVYIYRPGMDVECLENPASINGETVLPGFVLDLSKVW